ncbi:MAG: hypothetical protein AB1540_09435 [Bdellovibrionota bacterium]
MRFFEASFLSQLRFLRTAVLGASAFSSLLGFAKEVSLEWKPVPKAIRYELEIEHKGKAIVKKTTDENKWSGDLGFGFYAYKLRAIDKLKRPGAWSESKALVLMPDSPEPRFPKNREQVVLYDEKARLKIEWRESQGVQKYEVDVFRDGKRIFSRAVEGTRLDISEIARHGAGKYTWRVQSVVEADPRAPASLSGKKWKSEPKADSEFEVVYKDLAKPEQVYPRGNVLPPKDGKMIFKWKSVEGAEAYEVSVVRMSASSRDLASMPAGSHAKVFTTKENEILLKVPKEGKYSWQVRALANIAPDKTADAAGPKSIAEFKLDPSAQFAEGTGYVALSIMLAPYDYKVLSQNTGLEGTFKSSSFTLRLSGEKYFTPRWGISAAVNRTEFNVVSRQISRHDFELAARYRIPLDKAKHGWVVMPKFGFEYREYPELRPLSLQRQEFSLINLTAIGPVFGFDLRKQFNDEFSLGLKFAYYRPVILSGVDGTLSGGANGRNLSIGAQGLYWLSAKWGLGAGGFLEDRGVGYLLNNLQQEVQMNAFYFFGSLIYSFGR